MCIWEGNGLMFPATLWSKGGWSSEQTTGLMANQRVSILQCSWNIFTESSLRLYGYNQSSK